MNIALLFNSDAPEFGGSYGFPIKRKVFSTGIIQMSERHMKISVGDVLIYGHSKTWADYDELCERVYFQHPWALLHVTRLRATFQKATVYALVFENMTQKIATDLHRALTPDQSYLGSQAADYSYGPHLVFYRNFMIPRYRVQGKSCWVFYSMGEEDGKDEASFDLMREVGYQNVYWEDRGAHGTIFDDYDTPEHFERVEIFRAAVTPYMVDEEDGANELVMLLEDLNPALFNALGAAVEALDRASTEEHVAHVALSGRRYLEQLADVLFPARQKKYNGRKVGQAEYRNRIWAFITENVGSHVQRVETLGAETDRLVEEFNACLHGDQPKERVLRAFIDATKLTAALLALNPESARQPYFAYRKRIIEFMKEVAEQRRT